MTMVHRHGITSLLLTASIACIGFASDTDERWVVEVRPKGTLPAGKTLEKDAIGVYEHQRYQWQDGLKFHHDDSIQWMKYLPDEKKPDDFKKMTVMFNGGFDSDHHCCYIRGTVDIFDGHFNGIERKTREELRNHLFIHKDKFQDARTLPSGEGAFVPKRSPDGSEVCLGTKDGYGIYYRPRRSNDTIYKPSCWVETDELSKEEFNQKYPDGRPSPSSSDGRPSPSSSDGRPNPSSPDGRPSPSSKGALWFLLAALAVGCLFIILYCLGVFSAEDSTDPDNENVENANENGANDDAENADNKV